MGYEHGQYCVVTRHQASASLGRRAFLASAAAAAFAACSSGSRLRRPNIPGATTSTTSPPVSVVTRIGATSTTAAPHVQHSRLNLARTPYWPQAVLSDPVPLIDQHANVYLETADERDPQQFLMGWIPAVVIDPVLAGERVNLADALGATWAGGYWHGVWLRSLVDTAQPGQHRWTKHVGVSRDLFTREIVDPARARARQRSAGGGALIDDVDASLWRNPAISRSDPQGLIERTAFARGELEALIKNGPAGVAILDDYALSCGSEFACDFTNPKLNAVSPLDEHFGKRLRNEPGLAGLRRRIDLVDQTVGAQGAAVWQRDLSAAKFVDTDYVRLVDVQSSHLEALIGTTLLALESVTKRDDRLAKSASQAVDLVETWERAAAIGANAAAAYRVPTFLNL